MWFLKVVGRTVIAVPCIFALYVVIAMAVMGYVEGGTTWHGLAWLLALMVFGPLVARCIVWLQDWAVGSEEPEKEPPQPEQPRKPEQLDLWEAKP
jgi:hypothetical protein